jgi:hypothetical protein
LDRRAWRFVFFTLAILTGIAAGLGDGWAINPVQYTNINPDTLHSDYQTDFVLMVAELYHAEGDLALALARLDYLGSTSPQLSVNHALSHAKALQYANPDLLLMQNLAADIEDALDGIN